VTRLAWVGALAALLGCAWFPPLPTPKLSGAWATHHTASREIREASGLALSSAPPPRLWTHNDSGDRARLFLIDLDGALVAEYAVDGAKAIDWEDIASDGAGHLFVGDIGNNRSARRDLRVYRLKEPDPSEPARRVRVERTLRFRYADQTAFPDPALAYDAEALYFADGALWILTKHRSDAGTTLYRLEDSASDAEQVLQPVQRLALPVATALFGTVTAASVSADGKLVAVLLYTDLLVFPRNADGTLGAEPRAHIALDPRRTGQVEGIAWLGGALVFCNEPGDLFRIPNPLDPTLERYPP
jgi:hypothetical protein